MPFSARGLIRFKGKRRNFNNNNNNKGQRAERDDNNDNDKMAASTSDDEPPRYRCLGRRARNAAGRAGNRRLTKQLCIVFAAAVAVLIVFGYFSSPTAAAPEWRADLAKRHPIHIPVHPIHIPCTTTANASSAAAITSSSTRTRTANSGNGTDRNGTGETGGRNKRIGSPGEPRDSMSCALAAAAVTALVFFNFLFGCNMVFIQPVSIHNAMLGCCNCTEIWH